MSKTLRSLLPLGRKRSTGAPVEGLESAESTLGLEGVESADSGLADRSLDLSAESGRLAQLASVKRQNAHATLLDALRAVSGVSRAPSVVIAGIAQTESAQAVLDGVLDQASLRGVRLQIGDVVVTKNHRLLAVREHLHAAPGLAEESGAGATALSVVLTAPSAQEALENWFVDAGRGCDLLIVAAPPILSSVDALLVARACDGLVLVAEPLGTQREEFEIAIERARASGCQLLGLVMNENREWLPRLLGRLFTSYPRSIAVKSAGQS